MAAQSSYRASANHGRTLPRTPATGTSHVNVGPTERVLSVAAGAALAVYGLRRKSSAASVGLTTLGASLVLRGASGFCPFTEIFGRGSVEHQPEPIEIKETLFIDQPVERVYGYWRRLENLPRFMQHLESVRQLDERHSHWAARIPGGLGTVEWQSEITADEPNRLLAYRTLPGSQVDHSGEVRFRRVEGGGTEMQVIQHYRAPLGDLGKGVAKLLNPIGAQLLRNDIRRFKHALESGTAATAADSQHEHQ
jgi:uncharacterized membrane protein